MKRKVMLHANIFDVKNLCRKLLKIDIMDCYVTAVDDGDWRGWMVEFKNDVDTALLKEQIFGVSVLGKNVVFIGVVYG